MDIKALIAECGGDVNKALAEATRRLQATETALEQAKAGMAATLTLRVGEKGGVMVLGLGKFPVTLYREQWKRLLDPAFVARIHAFIADNSAKLKVKGAPATDTTPATGTDGK